MGIPCMRLHTFLDMSGNVNTACGGVGKGMGDSASVPDDIEAGITALQVFVHFHFHIIELDFYPIKQGVGVCRTGSNLVEGVDHFNDSV